MKNNILRWSCCFIIILIFQAMGWAASSSGIIISGAVKQPIRLTLDDLAKFQSISVRLNEVDSNKNFLGVFNYQGVPLRSILELAYVQKEESSFSKLLDMAIVIRNKSGKQIVLSWGEVFYKNPAETIIAFSATPIMPHKDYASLPKSDFPEKWFNQLKRPIGLPKLVVANDFYTDRSLEEITSIEMVDLNPKLMSKKMDKLHSFSFNISGVVKTPLMVADLSAYPRTEVMIKVVGDGKGYHGLIQASGVPLVKLLEKAGAQMDINTGYLISAPDGYRSLLSFGELFLNPAGGRIMIADQIDNKPIEKDGKFTLLLPDDLSADRTVKAVGNIEVINLKTSPKVYTISLEQIQ